MPSLAAWLLVTFAAAGLGAIASANAGEFYLSLNRPAWAPPAWLFGPVWSVLYLLMAIAAWLVWIRLAAWGPPFAWYVAQLVGNALWTWIFFAWRQGLLALIEILVLLVLIVATMDSFRKVSRLAAWMMAPYLAWVCFATALTLAMWRLNPDTL